ncbi:hypothetical protein [Saccharopolyspora elongata]|uniref:Uncharacterized protein n=1 Tax=Saccharopolyspora elongata TaxID=2530387 RepID=A0A4R4YCM3_9PSEU|nr:hypothetical protein [Saccharopolyspora elongata]TDD40922.1 hypothetical protein E1288_34320 [Saccharopolyspora elongata]
MSLHHPDFRAYRRRMIGEGKAPLVAAIAVGHRAHRLAFALMRTQKFYDADRWTRSVSQGGEQIRHGATRTTGHQGDVICSPQPTAAHSEDASK